MFPGLLDTTAEITLTLSDTKCHPVQKFRVATPRHQQTDGRLA